MDRRSPETLQRADESGDRRSARLVTRDFHFSLSGKVMPSLRGTLFQIKAYTEEEGWVQVVLDQRRIVAYAAAHTEAVAWKTAEAQLRELRYL